MVIEHAFVTTLESHQALALASEFLASRGFINAGGGGFQVHAATPGQPADAWTSIEMKRGVDKLPRAKSIADLPQLIRLEFDRGRITVAASIPAWTRSFWTVAGKEHRPDSPKAKPHVDLLMSIIWGLEQVLVHGAPQQDAASHWLQAEASLVEEARRRRRRGRIAMIIAITFCALALAALITAVMAS